MNKQLIKISKFLYLLLRHKPETIGLTLDQQGWAEIDILIDLLHKQGTKINRLMLEEIVANDNKQRFSFNQDKSKIRANQGHSLKVDLALEPKQPPEYLFHGTATRFIESIAIQGLQKQKRHHVHLSSDESTAIKVGQRHGKPVVLKIYAQKMSDAGFTFFLSDNQVWLTDTVPVVYIDFPNLSQS